MTRRAKKIEARVRGEVVTRRLDSVKPNGWNPNVMTPRVQRSIEHGFRKDGWISSHALLVWGTDERGVRRDVIIDGEHRWLAAIAVGLVEGPMVFLDGLTEREAKALTVKLDQKRGRFADDKLDALLKSIRDDAPIGEMALDLGFEDVDLNERLAPDRVPDDEEEPVIPTDALVKKWGTAPGQLWVVPSLTVPGREHRLLCGDCRDPANVARLHEGARPDLGLHDPPYGIAAVGEALARVGHGRNKRLAVGAVSNRQRGGKAHRTAFAPIVGDDVPFDPAHLLTAARRVVLWGANHYADKLPPSAEWIVWGKLTDEAGESHFSSAELAWVTQPTDRKGHVRRFTVLRGMGSVDGEGRLHPTQKPIAAQRPPIEWYSEPGDLVADWYMGAGAVIIACEQTGRIGHGMDIAHAYLAATLERLSTRGLVPRLVSTFGA